MNPLMMLGNNSNGNNLMMQAFSAMMRGENPRSFIKNLANGNPQLKGLNLDDLQGTAKALCDKNNIDMNELAGKIQEFANSNKS